MTKILVKVGDKSRVRFTNAKVYRAIVPSDLFKIADNNDDCHIVVIESISEDEQDAVREFAKAFKDKDSSNVVLFYIPDNDDVTSGIADELNENIFLTLKDLYDNIYNMFNVNVSIYLDDKRKINSSEIGDSIPEGVTDIFGEAAGAFEESIETAEEKAETVTESLEENVAEHEESEVTIESEVAKTSEKTETLNEEKEASEVDENCKGLSEDAQDIINKLTMQLNDAKYDYSVVFKDMQNATQRITSLEELVKTLEDEKQVMLDRYNSIVDTKEVIEDPISLIEYENLKDNISKLESTIGKQLTSIESYKETIASKEKDIEHKQETINELNESLSSLRAKLDSINESIESGEIHKEVIEEYTEKIEAVQKEKDELASKESELTSKIEELNSEIEQLHGEVEKSQNELADTVASLTEQLENAKALAETNKSASSELDIKITQLTSEKELLINDRDTLKSEVETLKSSILTKDNELRDLRNNEAIFNTKLEMANSDSKKEISTLTVKVSDLSKQLKNTEELLEKKEKEYNQLVITSGMDASGATTLAETNKTLESLNKTMREQLANATKELSLAKRREVEAQSSLKHYQEQCKQLNDTLKGVASAGIGGAAVESAVTNINNIMTPINYKGQAQIIPVFGSGSYGITTTAMSMIYRLYTTSKVLYIDFDMMSANADAWFKKLPLCKKVPGVDPSDMRMTGLGIFFEKGFEAFRSNINNIVIGCDVTKGGRMDYLSGLYYRVDRDKMLRADYNSLFNLLGSMYQYIIIDLGKLGCSDVNDRLIKIVSDIAFKNVVVTTTDKFEVRNFKIKLGENKININNIAWLFNMCESTNVEDSIRQTISPANFGMILRDTNLGKREKFMKDRMNKDKLVYFMDSVLFVK